MLWLALLRGFLAGLKMLTTLQANVYVQEARRLFKLDIDNVCLENIQSGILILNSCLAESRPELESLYFSLIVRQAQLLNLGVDHPQDDEITREVKKRIWWSLYMIDRWTSGGINLPRLLNFSPVNSPLALPMNELIFRDWGTHKNEENVHFQSWAQMIKLVYIYGHIQDLNNELVNGTMLFHEQHKIKESVLDLSKQLDRWYESLPQEMRFTESNLVIYQEKKHCKMLCGIAFGLFPLFNSAIFSILGCATTIYSYKTRIRKAVYSLCNVDELYCCKHNHKTWM